jgi:hypothetical protein
MHESTNATPNTQSGGLKNKYKNNHVPTIKATVKA